MKRVIQHGTVLGGLRSSGELGRKSIDGRTHGLKLLNFKAQRGASLCTIMDRIPCGWELLTPSAGLPSQSRLESALTPVAPCAVWIGKAKARQGCLRLGASLPLVLYQMLGVQSMGGQRQA